MQLVCRDQLVVLGAWAVLAIGFWGIGLLFCRLLRFTPHGADGFFLCLWSGWAAALFFLGAWHLFLPVDWRAAWALGVLGFIGVALGGRRPWTSLLRGLPRAAIPFILFLAAAWWISNRALSGASNGDSYLYHFPQIRWIAEHAAVPGLGNLHGKLAFCQSYFLYAAALGVGPLAGKWHHVANPFLVAALFGHALLALWRVLLRGRGAAPADLFLALCVPAVAGLPLDLNLTSPSPDIVVFVLGIVASARLVSLAGAAHAAPLPRDARADGAPPGRVELLALALVATAGVTVKLSFLAMGLALVTVGLLVRIVDDRPAPRRAAGTLALLSLVVLAGLVPWAVRSVVLSGYPFFPDAHFAAPVEWRVPAALAKAEAAAIRMWPTPLFSRLEDLRWTIGFLANYGCGDRSVLLPLKAAGVGVAVGLLALAARLALRRRERGRRALWLVLLPTVASLLFWVANTPMTRFAGSAFWVLGAQAVLLALQSVGGPLEGWLRRCAAAGAVVVALLPFAAPDRKPLLRRDLKGFELDPMHRYTETTLPSGLTVKVAEYGMCGVISPPCTPRPDPGLAMRRAGDPGAGFVIEPPPSSAPAPP